MGQDVQQTVFTGRDRQAFRAKVRRCLDVLAQMLADERFDFDRRMTGLEIELNLVNDQRQPAMRNAEVLGAIADTAFQTELGQFTIEINVPPRVLTGRNADDLEGDLRRSLNEAEAKARAAGAHIVMIGMLPTLEPHHLTPEFLSANPRYSLMNEQIIQARGEDITIDIEGDERLSMTADSIMPESACTSLQLHLQVSPQRYATTWNAAQCLAGVQVALGANSPFLFGKQLWRETRIALFEQATDTRPEELKAQGVRPRVWFGERWITSIFDQFEENVLYFPALLPVLEEEDPVEVLRNGGTPELGELRLHNGTIYRWNRPVYDVVGDCPHVRVENRVLPAGPTVVDALANAAFYYGVLHMLVTQDRPVWTRMSFPVAEENLDVGARDGIHAALFWPGSGVVPVTELVLRRLLPMAHEGLAQLEVDSAVSDRLLGIIEQRCLTHMNGAEWQVTEVGALEGRMDRRAAMSQMLDRYISYMHSNDPVHSWPVDGR